MRGCLICPLQSCSYNTHWQGTPQAAICCTKATSFFCSKPGFYYFHLLLLHSCSWGNQQVCSYPPCPCWSLSYRFLPFFYLFFLQAEFQLTPPDPCAAALPYLWLFSLPQFEAFPSLLYLLGRMTRKNHRELKTWDNHWFIQYRNYALVCLLFPS